MPDARGPGGFFLCLLGVMEHDLGRSMRPGNILFEQMFPK